MVLGLGILGIGVIIVLIIFIIFNNKNKKLYKGENPHKPMNVKNLVFGIVIFILTTSVGIYGINTFYKSAPQYQDFCPQINLPSECIDAGGIWINNTYPPTVDGGKPIPVEGGYCQYSYIQCQKDFDDAQKEYSRGVFLIALPLGIIVIAIGGLVFGLEFVGAGLMFGGLGIMIFGVVDYWRFADDWLKFALSLAGLIIVIGLAYYLNKRFKKKNAVK
ncbi:MAG: hypothetical protein PHF67_00565 [Candidatus Nanoarchaeia archaeon]|nr:hypothetical protein [Candidatus Nanoarchaeia archaeon]